MSHSRKKPEQEEGRDSLSDRLRRTSLSSEQDKPDMKEVDLGSPVSPLRPRTSGAPAVSSSSSSSSGSASGRAAANAPNPPAVRRSEKSHSGELSGSSDGSPSRNFKAGRSNSGNAPLIHARGSGGSSSGASGSGSGSRSGTGGGGSSVNSPVFNALPAGNICPSGKVVTSGEIPKSRRDVLGSGTGNYGHGSVMRGTGGGNLVGRSGGAAAGGETSDWATMKRAMSSSDPEVVKTAGNELYNKGNFIEALRLYDRAIAISPRNAACRSNRAAALTSLGRLGEAVRECEEALKFDPGYVKAHQRLSALHLRLGQVDNARKHLNSQGQRADQAEMKKLQDIERHLNRCSNSRKIGDWKGALRECDAAIAAGADSSPQLFASRAECLLKLHQLEDANNSLSGITNFEEFPLSCLSTKFFGMHPESYILLVRAQVKMAFGKFEDALAAAEKAGQIDRENVEVGMTLNNMHLVANARKLGNDLYNSGKFAEACTAYGEGLRLDPSNAVLYCNRAACWSNLGHWERSVEDCNQALRIQPNYTKALLRRATSNSKIERWVECVRDYEALRKMLPGDNNIEESLFHATVTLKKSRGEDVSNLKFGGEVEEVSDLDQFRAAISSPGISVVHFKANSNRQSEQMSPFFDTLCSRYPSVNFIKVDVEKNSAVARAENVNIMPTFKIYKKGSRLKEMICPSQQVLENSVRHYSL